LSLPGDFLAAAINSLTDVMPVEGLTTMSKGEAETLVIGSKSLGR
jgi:hypothetical protein